MIILIFRKNITVIDTMLKRFTVENYKNFKNQTKLDFDTVHNYSFNSQFIKNDLLNKVILLGKNGSGKTNLGLALFDIVLTLTDNVVDPKQTDQNTFLNGDSNLDYASFSYEFLNDGHTIEYRYRKKDPRTIIYEELLMDKKLIFRRDNENDDYKGLARLGADKLRMDIKDGQLSVVRYVNANTVQTSDSPIAFIMDFVSHMLYFKSDIYGFGFIGYDKSGESIYDYIINNGLTDEFQRMLSEYTKIDVRLDSVKIPGMPGVLIQKFKNRDMRFDTTASTGTLVFSLFYYWFKHMNNVRFLYMDEYDAYYHYELSERIVRLVSGMEDFQTVFTTHNVSLLKNELLRPDCCLLLEDGVIRSFSDSTDRELRQGHNLEKMYKNGEFDG